LNDQESEECHGRSERQDTAERFSTTTLSGLQAGAAAGAHLATEYRKHLWFREQKRDATACFPGLRGYGLRHNWYDRYNGHNRHDRNDRHIDWQPH
jgi:hypothetical protein